jgi:hypothetical protein
MSNTNCAAFYGFLFGVNATGLLHAMVDRDWGLVVFLSVTSVLSGVGCLVFLDGDPKKRKESKS